MEWKQFFSHVPDFRIERSKLHLLDEILMLSLCAVLCGAEDFEDIENYGKEKEAFLRTFLSLPNGIASHDTIDRVFRYMDKDSFQKCLLDWSKELLDFINYHQINIDGKVLRGTARAGKPKSGICLVSAWACEQGLCLGQLQSEEKSNEITAIPQLLASLDVKDAVVSIDAIACHQTTASLIVEKEGHYLLSLKKNNKGLYEQVADYLQARKTSFESHKWEDFGSGRIETRTAYLCNGLDLLDDLQDWPAISSVVMIEAKRESNGKVEEETRFYLSSLKATAADFNHLVRSHWSIENSLHWHLDVTFNEDRSRICQDNAPANMGLLRKIALQVLKQASDKQSIKSRRKIAGWNDEYLMCLLRNLRF
jgi:predicted transposase YbfD/YdcC